MDLGAFRDKRVLVTGGLGFVGSTLAIRLAELGARVAAVDSLIPEYGGNLFNLNGYEEKVRVNIADVRDEFSMSYLVKDHDYLFNLTGQTSHIDSMENPFVDLDINCRAQLFILEACRRFNPAIKVVYASTRQIYGKPDFLPVHEGHPIRPVDINGIHKVAGEWYHLLYNNVYSVRATALRLTNTYGPRMRVKDARQTFLGVWIRDLIEKKPIEVWGDGLQIRDFNYVDDVVDAFLKVGLSDKANGQVYNLGGFERINLRDLAALVIRIHGGGEVRMVPFPDQRRVIDIGDYYGASDKIRREFQWSPRTGLEEGLGRTLDYYQRHMERYL